MVWVALVSAVVFGVLNEFLPPQIRQQVEDVSHMTLWGLAAASVAACAFVGLVATKMCCPKSLASVVPSLHYEKVPSHDKETSKKEYIFVDFNAWECAQLSQGADTRSS